MKRKIYLIIFCFFTMVLFLNSTGEAASEKKEHPALRIMRLYERELPEIDFFEPYTVSLLAMNELENNRNIDAIKDFINWYFSRLNYPDKHGLTGTIYDYTLRDGKEWSTRKYDSVDGYSGLFLHLLHRYIVLTGDTKIALDNWEKVEDIVYTIVYMMDKKDGLTRALPNTDEKYLMDNCESYGGITAFLNLQKLLNKKEDPYYSSIKLEIYNGIFKNLFDKKTNNFLWVIKDGESFSSSWDIYYPDSYAQIFLIYYGLLDEQPKFKAEIWYKFNERYGVQSHTFPIEQRIMYELTKRKNNF